MTESKILSGFNSYISFIGNDRTAHWSHFRNAGSDYYYQEKPAVNICCKLMDVTLGSCEQCPVSEAFLSQSFRQKELFINNDQKWLVSAHPAYDSQGNFLGVFQTGEDITEHRKKGEQQSKNKFLFPAEKLSELIVVLDVQGKIIFVNHVLSEMSGKHENELIGILFDSLIHPDDKPEFLRTFETLRNNSGKLITEYRIITSLGLRSFACSGSALYNQEGEISAIILVGREVLEVKPAELSETEDKMLLSGLVSNLPGMAYRCKNDDKRTMEFVSQGCDNLTGYQPETFLQNKLSFTEIIAIGFHQAFEIEWQKAIDEKRAFRFEYQIVTSDGKLKWVWEEGQVISDQHGEVIAVEGFIQDITERKNKEIALIHSEGKYRNMIENALVGIYSTTLNGDLIIVNDALCRMLEYDSVDDLMAIPNIITRYKNPSDRPKMLEMIRNSGKLTDMEITWLTKNGREIFVLISAVLHNGTVSGMVIDISQRKQTELEMFEQKERAELSDKLKTAFLANISHEIRTPLNGILGFTEILLEHDIAPSDKEHYSNLIQNLSGQLLSIVNDILEISRIETNQIKLSNSQININLILKRLFTTFEKQAKGKNLNLILNSELNESQALIVGDGLRLVQVLTHLLNNAIKFTYSGSITYGCRISDEKLLFYVQDTGIGINSENKALIFERFRQVEDTLTRKFGGSGLGLSISKALVEMMGGNIFVDSDSGRGSTFFFTIPYNVVSKKQKILRNHLETKSCLRKCKILICEDDDFGYLYVNRLLTQAGAITTRSISGNKAIQLCQSDEEFDLIIMDLRMPEMSGKDAAEFIKKLRPSIPIIVCTASTSQEVETLLNKQLFDDVVYKPIKSSDLLETICRLV